MSEKNILSILYNLINFMKSSSYDFSELIYLKGHGLRIVKKRFQLSALWLMTLWLYAYMYKYVTMWLCDYATIYMAMWLCDYVKFNKMCGFTYYATTVIHICITMWLAMWLVDYVTLWKFGEYRLI